MNFESDLYFFKNLKGSFYLNFVSIKFSRFKLHMLRLIFINKYMLKLLNLSSFKDDNKYI